MQIEFSTEFQLFASFSCKVFFSRLTRATSFINVNLVRN